MPSLPVIRSRSGALLRHLPRSPAAPNSAARSLTAPAPPSVRNFCSNKNVANVSSKATTEETSRKRLARHFAKRRNDARMTPAGLHRELKKVEAKVDEYRRLYDGLSLRSFPFVVMVFMLGQWGQNSRIDELKESVDMLKEEREKEKAGLMTSSSSATPTSESELSIASDTPCVGST